MNRKNKFSVGRARAQGLSRGLLPSSGSSAMRCYVSWLSKGVAHGAKSEPPPCPGTGLLEPACRIPPCHPPTGVAQAAAKSQMCCHNGRTEGSRLSFPVTIPLRYRMWLVLVVWCKAATQRGAAKTWSPFSCSSCLILFFACSPRGSIPQSCCKCVVLCSIGTTAKLLYLTVLKCPEAAEQIGRGPFHRTWHLWWDLSITFLVAASLWYLL